MEEKEFKDFVFDFNRRLHENKLKIKMFMALGNFHWFKPIYDLKDL